MNTQVSRLCLLDTPMLKSTGGDIALQLRYRKALGLLGFLSAERNRNHSRVYIASLFWPDLDESSARVNLRQVLSILSKLFNDHPFHNALQVSRHFIALHDHPLLQLDIFDLQTLQQQEAPFHEDSLLTGEFMAGYSLPDCEEFESWLADKRAFFRSCQVRLLNTLLAQAQTDRQSGLVISYVQKLLQIDPDNESLLREAMRLCNDHGQSRLALRLFENFAQRMERELGVLPDNASLTLYNQLAQQLNEQIQRPVQPDQFPAVEKISPVVVVHLQWRCNLPDPEAAAQKLFDADHYSRKLLCDEIGAFHLNSAGRGAFFYFGWPQALEDNAWMAVRSTIRLMHYARTHPEIDLRAGIHSGLLLSSQNADLPDLLGDVTEETSLLCQSASDSQILLSEPCYTLLERKVQARKMTERRRRNDGSLSAAYLLEDEPTWIAEMPAAPLPEMRALYDDLTQLRNQALERLTPVLISLTGPAGSGKSVQATQWLKQQRLSGDRVFKLRCYPDRKQHPFFPLISCLRQLLGLQADEVIKPDTLRERLYRHGWDKLAAQPLLIDLVTRNTPPSEQSIRQAFGVIASLLQPMHTPCLLLWVEDGHWIDPATLKLIELLPSLTPCPVLLLMTARQLPEAARHLEWQHMTLPAISTESAIQLLNFFSRDRGIWRSPDEIQRLLTLTEHNPYLLKAMAHQVSEEQIPAQVQQHFCHSIDQLGEQRDEALKRALCWPDDDQPPLLQGPPVLQHVMASLNPPSRRRYVHKTLALALQNKRQNQARLAYHWRAAGELEKAADTYLACAQQALAQKRYTEAAHCLGETLKLDTSVGYPLEQRITLLNDLAHARIMAFGYGDRYAFKAASEASQLAKQLMDKETYFRSIYLLFLGIGSMDGQHSRLQSANLLYDYAQTPAQLTLAHWALANSHFWQGRFSQSRAHAEQALALVNQANSDELNSYSHDNPAVLTLGFLCWAWCFDDQPDEALSIIKTLLALPAASLSDSSHCYQLFFAASTLARCGKPEQALGLAQQCHQIAISLQHHLWLCASELLLLSLNASTASPVQAEQIDWLIGGIKSTYADGLPMAALLGTEALIRSGLSAEAHRLVQQTLEQLTGREHEFLLQTLQKLLQDL